MISILLAVGSFLGCFIAGNRSLKAGLYAIIGIGYVYGIVRANYPDSWTYLMFDLGVIGLFTAQLWKPMTPAQRLSSHDLRIWTAVLIGWPVLLFIAFPTDNPLVQAVGLRANVFLLPFLIFGARLTNDDLRDFGRYLAVLNLAAVGLATIEFVVGIEPFFPVNEVTDIIYKSRDLVGRTAYRIPSSFSSAHAFAGTMTMTLPLLIGAWKQKHEWKYEGILLATAVVASFVGVFMAAARTHMITVSLLALVVTFGGGLSARQWIRWVGAVLVVGYVVAGDARFQRFTTLQDRSMVSERIGGSVNDNFFDVVSQHPLGRGLADGGTSVPYFLREGRDSGTVIENEYARIALEQGLPGLVIWILFIVWVLTRRPGRVKDTWLLSRRLVWVTCASMFASGMLGMGMLAAVPQTVLMLILIGWTTTVRRPLRVSSDTGNVESAA
jgi:O-antigen ligase/polysaccharide polymerase Wzy-like membrane protein